MKMHRPYLLAFLAAAFLNGCAAPPLKMYTLGGPSTSLAPRSESPSRVIAVSRVVLPDYLDNTDLLIRKGSLVQRSAAGRWTTRFSLGVTDLLIARLAARCPNALVTDQPQTVPATDRIDVNISRLDTTTAGSATLDADWTVVPLSRDRGIVLQRRHIAIHGSTATDQAAVTLQEAILAELADAVGASLPCASTGE